MFRCKDCEAVFSEPFEYEEETGVTGSLGAFGNMKEMVFYSVCPECGSENYDDAPVCDICGSCENMPHEKFWGEATVCDDCYEDMESLIAIAINNFSAMHPDAKEQDMYDLIYEIVNEKLE